MKETVKLFLEVIENEMLDSGETRQYVTFEYIASFLDEDETIEEFYRTLTELCSDYGFVWKKTTNKNHMWNINEPKHFDIFLIKVD